MKLVYPCITALIDHYGVVWNDSGREFGETHLIILHSLSLLHKTEEFAVGVVTPLFFIPHSTYKERKHRKLLVAQHTSGQPTANNMCQV